MAIDPRITSTSNFGIESTVASISTTIRNVSTVTNDPNKVRFMPHRYVEEINNKEALKLIIPIIFTAIMMVIGVIGNSLVIYIYNFRWHKTTTKLFVTTLAILDLVNCVITMPTEIVVLRNFYYLDAPGFCRLSRFSTFWMNNNSAVVLLIISIDRFIKICLPTRQSFSYRAAKIACVLSVLVGLAVSWPGLVLYGNYVVLIPTKHGVMKFIMCNVQNHMTDTWYPFAYYIYLWVGFLSTALVMVILYVLIGVQIWGRKARTDKRSNSAQLTTFQFKHKPPHVLPGTGKADSMDNITSSSTETSPSADQTSPSELSNDDVFHPPEKPEPSRTKKGQPRGRLGTLPSLKISKSGIQAGKATLMLFVITLVYIISFLPFLVITVMRTLSGPLWYGQLSDTEKVVVNLFLRSYLISNTANPLIYGFCNAQFRRECVRLFHRLTCR
ncbi:gastrin/cholecystokinin type B receptor-like [Gigantopelta aegis]|uniref:gastrin/cholecystokinin type B receptor-like n=1 Tax=Gigantopelta aegis TaxID=1735272 RepID=UPI001B88D4C7|nr:gastrin/cholecystokinin type B receptor-like [Gigantopelta aegis]